MLTGAGNSHLFGSQPPGLLVAIALIFESADLPVEIFLLHIPGAVRRANVGGIALGAAVIHHLLQLRIAALVYAPCIIQRLNIHGKSVGQGIPGIHQHQVPYAVSLFALGIAALGGCRLRVRLRFRLGGRLRGRGGGGLLNVGLIGSIGFLVLAAAQC